MTMILAICVAVTFAVSIYLMLGRELKGVAMGVFLLGHAANLSIIAMSGSPVKTDEPVVAHVEPAEVGQADNEQKFTPADKHVALAEALEADVHLTSVDSLEMKAPPVLATHETTDAPLAQMVDPLPQALILTAIVIGFGVMGFLLTLLVVTNRKTRTIEVTELAEEARQA